MATEQLLDSMSMEQTPLAAAWRFRWLVLLTTLLGAALAFVFASTTATTQYEATASLVVTDPRASTLFSSDEVALNETRYVEDQIAILRSDSVTQRAGETIEAETGTVIDPIEFAETIRIFTTAGNEILIEYTAADETTAVTTVNAVITAYGEVRGEAAARDSASAIAQLDQSIDAIEIEITAIEESIDAERASSLQGDLDRQYEEALTRLVQLQREVVTASAAVATADAAFAVAVAADPDADEEDLAAEAAAVEAANAELEALRSELADIDLQLTRLAQIAALEQDTPELTRLFAEQREAIARRTDLATQRDRLLVDTELLSGGISLASPAQFASELRTDVTTMTILGGLVGLLIGGAIAYLLAVRRRKFDERAQPGWVLQTSMLAEIPVFGDEGLNTELPVLEYPASASAEAFRFAATALELPRRSEQSDGEPEPATHTFLVTSPGPKEGKTILTANLALAAARKGRSVLAIDADFGNQRLSELLHGGPVEGPGITEVVEAGLDIISGTFSLGEPGPLHLMSRGQRSTNAPDFFSLPATAAFIGTLGRLYDLVFIDGPPMLHVAYASVLARYVEQVIVVTRHESPVSRLEDLSQRLKLIGTPLAGYVYNGAPLRYEMTLTGGSLSDILGGPTQTG